MHFERDVRERLRRNSKLLKKEGGSQEVRLRWYVSCGFLQRRYIVGGDTRLEQRLVPHKTQVLLSVFYTHCRAESSLLFL